MRSMKEDRVCDNERRYRHRVGGGGMGGRTILVEREGSITGVGVRRSRGACKALSMHLVLLLGPTLHLFQLNLALSYSGVAVDGPHLMEEQLASLSS